MNPPPRLLLIEDDRSLAAGLESVLTAEGYTVTLSARGDTGCELASTQDFEVILTDLRLPGLGGLDVVRRLHAAQPARPIILMTAHGTTETAIEATKLGAYDYLLKPFEMEELIDLVSQAVTSSRQASTRVELGGGPGAKEAIIGQSRAMQAIYKEIGRIAPRPVSVLIRGETGTGKELIARALHQHSDRARGPFVAVNCAAIPETLLESELFGHERGAFTGAVERRIGRFEQAAGGTLFLDEIGEMGASTQAKLLRVLQERVIQRVGGRETIPVDVRLLAATHVNLEAAIAAKEFREDLYYRLNQVTVALPPLRDRPEDLPALITHFLHKHGETMGVTTPTALPEAVELLRSHRWPGNVRELENAVRQALLLSRGYPLNAGHVRAVLLKVSKPSESEPTVLNQLIGETLHAAQRGEVDNAYATVVQSVERELFTQAILLAEGNQAKAARWLGISRVTMREKLRQFGLKDPRDPEASGPTEN